MLNLKKVMSQNLNFHIKLRLSGHSYEAPEGERLGGRGQEDGPQNHQGKSGSFRNESHFYSILILSEY